MFIELNDFVAHVQADGPAGGESSVIPSRQASVPPPENPSAPTRPTSTGY